VNVIEHGTGTPLVLLHGFGIDHRALLPLDPVLEAAGGWRRLYLDLPGAGGTPVGDVASTQDVVAAVEAELDRRIGDEPFAVLGQSFGGMVARQVAHDLRPRVLGLATVAGVFVAEHARRTVPPATVLRTDPEALALAGEAAGDYAEGAVVQSVPHARAFLDHVRPGLLAADPRALARIAARYSLDREPEDAHPEPFTRPGLVLTARQDQVVGYEDAWARREHYPRTTFAVLDAAGHDVQVEQPALTGALVADWLARVRAEMG
jgi:pimeloyl-ACP methyl ester carboxylesterase